MTSYTFRLASVGALTALALGMPMSVSAQPNSSVMGMRGQGPCVMGGAMGPGGGRGGMGMMMTALDADSDGKITRDEFDAAHQGRFEMLDADGDGRVTPTELQANQQARRAQRQQSRFDQADTNGDGAITPDEFNAHTDRQFQLMDVDGDGLVAVDEAQTMMSQCGYGPGTGPGMGQGKGPGMGPGGNR